MNVNVLDIGFGTGTLGQIIKANDQTKHWNIDGIDGWQPNCLNVDLISKRIYRNIYFGLAQDISLDQLKNYNIICLLDVIEHLDIETSKWLMRTLLTNMSDSSYLFISTPLWFYPQSQQQNGDLEEHLIGVPIGSLLSLMPEFYAINHPLVGGFVYSKKSMEYIDFFQPTMNKNFSYEMGLNHLKILNIPYQQGIFFKPNR